MSLYRKYRPQKFSDLYGQEHIVKTVTNALQGESFSHAYLFSGPKGSGKTTTARLLAKALNCQGRVLAKEVFEPCNRCLSCKEIITGSNLDLVEIDAASNRGIDEIRELRDKIRFAPASNRFKIYIIDECHMLTKEAFNALLKTLEEPPPHAIFILATTELHKVPPTILSRTQSFEFKKAKAPEILKLLKKIAKTENIKIHDDALNLISRLSFGAFRDAISMLDQVSTLGIDGRHIISLEEVQVILGQTTEKMVWEFCENISRAQREEALKIIENLYFDGKDLENFIHECVSLFRKLLLFQAGLNLEDEVGEEGKKRLENISKTLTLEETTFIIEKLILAGTQVKTSALGQLPLEMAVFEITEKIQQSCLNAKDYAKREAEDNSKIQNEISQIKNDNDLQIIESKIPKLNHIVENKKAIGYKLRESVSAPASQSNEAINTKTQVSLSPDKWAKVVKLVKSHNNTIAAMIKNTAFHRTTDHQIILAVKFKFHAEQICNKKNLSVIESAVEKVSGKQYKIDCIVDKDLDLKKPLEAEEEVINGAKEVFEVDE